MENKEKQAKESKEKDAKPKEEAAKTLKEEIAETEEAAKTLKEEIAETEEAAKTLKEEIAETEEAAKTVNYHDFIEIEYTGKLKDSGDIFDTTDEKLAKDKGLYHKDMRYGAVIVCVGESHLLKGLDEALAGKETKKKYTLELQPEKAFGKKSVKLVQLISTSKFTKDGVTPQPGLQVNIDGMMGVVKTVTGGRTLVDFNHPLANRHIIYEFTIKRIIKSDEEKAKGLVELQLGKANAETEVRDHSLTIKFKGALGEEYKTEFGKEIQKLIPAIKKVEFVK